MGQKTRWVISFLQGLALIASLLVGFQELARWQFILVLSAAILIVTVYIELMWKVKAGDGS
jgi:cytochrome c oxidase subunit IV